MREEHHRSSPSRPCSGSTAAPPCEICVPLQSKLSFRSNRVGFHERLGERVLAQRCSAHLYLIGLGCRAWDAYLLCRGASRFAHDSIVGCRSSVCARIPVAACSDVSYSIPNLSFDIANTCIPQRLVASWRNQAQACAFSRPKSGVMSVIAI